MFVDFALLTEQQGELLDQIEFQVKAAADYIDDGNKELVESIQYQKSIRKRQLYIVIILLVVLGIIVLVIMGATGNLRV
jgi:t-SNARE complex subunit (syntaxin)